MVFGPVLIATVILVCVLDTWIEGAALPSWLRPLFWNRPTAPPGVVLFLLAAGAAVLASRELAAILKANGVEASKRITTTAAIGGLLVSCIVPSNLPAPVAVAVVSSAAVGILLVSLLFHSRRKTVEGVVASAGGTLLALVYLGLMAGFLLAIRREHSVWVLAWVILTTKACDIGAYFAGRKLGRHKLIPWLSPGKTWEGLFGGLATSAVVGAAGLAALRSLEPGLPPVWTGAFAGVVFGLTGQFGDLIESLFKRDAGIKDASSMLPGFGGVLDVLDSPLMVAPIAYWWLSAVHA
jgi:phosphatidate cytidylyltransferase